MNAKCVRCGGERQTNTGTLCAQCYALREAGPELLAACKDVIAAFDVANQQGDYDEVCWGEFIERGDVASLRTVVAKIAKAEKGVI